MLNMVDRLTTECSVYLVVNILIMVKRIMQLNVYVGTYC